ncbi:transglycosylase SLT domain-containing protein [Luteimonas sp. XNQY3]|nr:transglycosylase SLT domain-containing protein [Luteimonas sp. XNQY3]MCD9007465.1 transglycosylase SLT domain-containing protein [Luteimonas sp. XNQY3]
MAPALSTRQLAGLAAGIVALAASGLGPRPAHAVEVPPPAYQIAARQAGIPSSVLYAVALQESGTRRRDRLVPWPWTLNVAGSAERYATRAEACAGIRRALARVSARRVDVGLAQINLGYQAHRYDAPCDVLDPYANLAMAAQILREQHEPGADWMIAIGRYHRPAGGEPAARYRRSVARHLARVQAHDQPTAQRTEAGGAP